jgi:UDP-N-acetylglucosamine pyrophosphorylase
LGYTFTTKIKNISIIYNFDKYKIVINSAEVHLGITRSHAEVEHKNIIIFSYKNHLDRYIINTKQFILKDLQQNFMQLLVQMLGMA